MIEREQNVGSGDRGPALPRRSRTARGHRPDCACKVCLKIQAAIDAGKPTKAELREQKRLAKIARAKATAEQRQLERKAKARAKSEAQKVTEARVAGAILGSVAAGTVPSLTKVAEVTGASLGTVKSVASEDFVRTALVRAGITDDKLAAVAAEGLDAKNTKLVFDRDGNVVDAIELPDHQNRHRFWHDILTAKGVLGEKHESGGGGGGLIIIAPEAARVLPGHPPACTCDECIALWNEKTKHLQARAARAMAVDAEIIENPKPLPESLDAPEDDFETDDFSDRDDEDSLRPKIVSRNPSDTPENPEDEWEDEE